MRNAFLMSDIFTTVLVIVSHIQGGEGREKEKIYQLIRLDLENDDMLIHRLQGNNKTDMLIHGL